MSGFTPKKLTRATTFDERRSTNALSHDKNFTKLVKRSQTFVGKSSTETNTTQDLPKFLYSDVVYRRYFGMTGDDTKLIPPLNQNKIDISSIALPVIPNEVKAGERDAVIIVDVFSTGAFLAHLHYHAGYKIICVLSGDLRDLLNMQPEGVEFRFTDTFVYNSSIESDLALDQLLGQIQDLNLNVVSVMAGAETGVELADQLSELMNLRTNGTALSEARRNKYVMGETVRAAGLRAVKQLRATSWGEIESWIMEWNPQPFKVIVKPMDSAGSDDVTLCFSLAEVQKAFGNIMGKINGLGIVNKAVLVQEYLEGIEYIIDMVSRDGVHKLAAIWEYDRRAINGAGFVCFAQRLMMPDEPRCREMVDYQKKVITSLGIRNGPTHGEVKWFKGEPVLVEVGARCQGGDGMWVKVADECIGYDQVQMTMYSYLNPQKFAELPDEPPKRYAFGSLKWLINYKTGLFHNADTATVNEINAMESYRGHQIFPAPGKHIVPTQNCFTWGGCVQLVNKNENHLIRDSQRLEEVEKTTLFNVEEIVKEVVVAPIVAVVDPFSTGAILAAELSKLGYGVVALYSARLEQLANVQNLVPQGLSLAFEAVIGFDDDLQVINRNLSSLNRPILAVFAGAETGVELADQLSELMNLRTNGTALSEARRNKYVMGETVRAAGLRAVKQLRATSWGEIESWIMEWNPQPFKVIVKPMDSAGSDGVTLCQSLTEVRAAFDSILGKVNGLGIVNKAVLVQEYLEGQEYVIDMVSRDGVHKVAAIWAYDRRAVNGAGFVCFGQRLLTADEPHCRELIEYQKKVITALGIRNGPTHGEVKWFKGEPVLVEVGARCHGAEGQWKIITDYVYGYDQVQMTIQAYLNGDQFNQVVDEPVKRNSYGRLLFFVVKGEGILDEVDPDMLDEIEHMQSFIAMELFVKNNTYVKKTIDCYTFGGVLRLVNENLDQLVKDYERIREMESTGLFKFQ